MSATRDTHETSKPQSSTRWWHTPFAAAFAGYTGAWVVYLPEGLKKRKQQGDNPLRFFQPATANSPRRLLPVRKIVRDSYRGVSPFSAALTTATVTQMSFNRLLQAIPGFDANSQAHSAAAAMASGVLGATFGTTPGENFILYQQRNHVSPLQAAREMLQQGPSRLMVGWSQYAVREAGFAFSMLFGARAARKAALDYTGSQRAADVAEASTIAASTTLTHPFDTIATTRQKENGRITGREAYRKLVCESGHRGLFRGLGYRTTLIYMAIKAITTIEKHTKDALESATTTHQSKRP